MSRPKKSVPLEENSNVKELLAILDAHESPGAKDLRAMLANVAKMEQQLAAAVTELSAMRQELSAIREENHPLRKVLQSAVVTMQGQILKLRDQIDAMKTAIIEGCKNVLTAFKERGAAALNNIAGFFKLRPALEAIAKSCDQTAKDSTKTINTVERVSKEYHKAGRHLRNIGRAMTGKELIPSMKPVGKVAQAVEAPLKAVRACNLAIRNAARDALKSLSQLEKAAERKPLIEEQYQKAVGEAARYNATRDTRAKPVPAKDR